MSSLHSVFLPQNAVEKRKMRSKVLSCTYLALPSAIIVATVNLMATSAWAEHYPSWFQGCAQAVGGVVLQRKRPMAALLHYCQATVGTAGLSDGLSDCRTVDECGHRGITVRPDTVGTLSEHCWNCQAVDCRTVRLSDCWITAAASDPKIAFHQHGRCHQKTCL